MQKARLGTVSVVLCLFIQLSANAQMSQKSLGVRQTAPVPAGIRALDGGAQPSEASCGNFTNTISIAYKNKFPKKTPNNFESGILPDLRNCVEAIDYNIPELSDINSADKNGLATLKGKYGLSTPDQVNEQLITTHYLSRLLRRWANLDSTTSKDVLETLNDMDGRLHALMDQVGLLDPFAGSLVAGPAFGDTGKLSPGTTSASGSGSTSTSTTSTAATSSGTKTQPLAHIEWSSKHFGEESFRPVDFNFGGSFGLQPALSLLTNPPAATTTTPPATTTKTATTSQYQSAFVWSLGGRANIHTGTTAETSGFFRSGQLRLLSGNGTTIVDQGANSTLQIPLNGNADRLAWFYETGVEFNYYNKSLEIVHAEKGQLDPAFNIGISYKNDTRFKQSAGVVGFDSPEKRLVFRFMVNGLKIFDRRPDTTTSKPYAISFGVEHERGFGSNPVPSGTQIIIRGDINLLKLINPGSGS